MGCVRERAVFVLAVLGRTAGGELSSVRASCVPELRRMWGGPLPRGDCGMSDMAGGGRANERRGWVC